jgi:NAD(P)-dependent dehydrogenase (short-subunit alcohol dehydrogenase family)
MSQALFERAAEGRHSSAPAGTRPGERIHPQVVDAMRELDIDLSDRIPTALTRELRRNGTCGSDPSMEAGGRIISIGSCFVERVPYPELTLYAMSKAALTGMTKASLAISVRAGSA